MIYDPRKGDTIRERISLQGNPAINDDWWTNPKTGQMVDFIDFARSEGRFGKHFDKEGNPSETLLFAKKDRLENWHVLQDLAGVRGVAKAPAKPAKAEGATTAAKPAGAAPVKSPPAAAKTNGRFAVGMRIKYKDGANWIGGVVESLTPAVLKLDDQSVISTNLEVLESGAAEGIIVSAS